MKIGGYEIPLKLWQVEEILEKRIEQQRHKISDLFMIWSSRATKPDPGFFEAEVQTKYGILKFFFLPDLQADKAFVLHTAKFPYPKRENHDYDLRGFDKNGNLKEDAHKPNG